MINLKTFSIFAAIFIIAGVLSNWIDWMNYVMLGITIITAIFILIGIVYGWIINPIRQRKVAKALAEADKNKK